MKNALLMIVHEKAGRFPLIVCKALKQIIVKLLKSTRMDLLVDASRVPSNCGYPGTIQQQNPFITKKNYPAMAICNRHRTAAEVNLAGLRGLKDQPQQSDTAVARGFYFEPLIKKNSKN